MTTTLPRLTPHQAEVLDRAARHLVRGRGVCARRYAACPYRLLDGVGTYAVPVGSAGALAHLADRGYLAPVEFYTPRSNVEGYVLTDAGRAYVEARRAVTA